ncbi:MAG: 50S ribosomal protein L35 [Parcubacteria group bacterium]|nr:50S ribosomal protein L35 [Parcubacteria group bacterium]
MAQTKKTNKSYTKRLKVTKTGKILARKGGIDHFRARKSRQNDMDRARWKPFAMTPKAKQQFLR